MGFEKAYFVSLGDKGSPWWRVEPQEPLHWLESLVRCGDHGAPEGNSPIRSRWGNGLEDLSVLSSDGQRALILVSREDDLISFHLPTRILVQRAETGLRLLELAKDLIPGSRNPPKPPRERLHRRLNPRVSGFQQPAPCPCVPAEAVLHAPHCLRRWRCEPGDDVEGFFARVLAGVPGWPHERPYSLAIGAFGPLAWTGWASVRRGGFTSFGGAVRWIASSSFAPPKRRATFFWASWPTRDPSRPSFAPMTRCGWHRGREWRDSLSILGEQELQKGVRLHRQPSAKVPESPLCELQRHSQPNVSNEA